MEAMRGKSVRISFVQPPPQTYMAVRVGMNTFPLAADMKVLREPELLSNGSKSKIETESMPKSYSRRSKGDQSFGAGFKTMTLTKRL